MHELVVACGGDASDEEPGSLRVFDIREPGCQRRAAELAAYLRDGTTVLPQIDVVVVNAEQFIAEAEATWRAVPLTPRAGAFRVGLRALGASEVPADYGSVVRGRYEQTGALYLHDERLIKILDWGPTQRRCGGVRAAGPRDDNCAADLASKVR